MTQQLQSYLLVITSGNYLLRWNGNVQGWTVHATRPTQVLRSKGRAHSTQQADAGTIVSGAFKDNFQRVSLSGAKQKK